MENTELGFREKFVEQGYVVLPQLLNLENVDALLGLYRTQILPSEKPFFRQNTNRWERSRRTPQGYVIQSFRDPHDFAEFPEFSRALRSVIAAPEVMQTLRSVLDESELGIVQSMMFDFNTATRAHQDWYYLDSVPSGHLVGVWFALEDIAEDAGRFFVVPGTHKKEIPLTADEILSNGLYLDRVKQEMSKQGFTVTAPALKKGDALVWHGGTIHGALETKNSLLSRKSLTAHYMPTALTFGNRYNQRPTPANYFEESGVKFRKVPPLHSEYTVAHHLESEVWRFFQYHPKLYRTTRTAYRAVKGLFAPTRGLEK